MFIGLCACACLALALSTVLVPMELRGSERWLWMVGLFVATLGAAGLFTLFLRHAGRSLDAKPRGARH